MTLSRWILVIVGLLVATSAWAVTYLGNDAEFHAVSFSDLPNVNANSVWGNTTGSGGVGGSVALPSCSSGVNAVTYTTNSGFGCNTFSASAPITISAGGVIACATCGGITLLNTLTASNSATLSDTTSLTASYSAYMLVFENLIPATDEAACEIQVHSGGAFKNTGYLSQTTVSNAGALSANTGTTTFINCAWIANGQTSQANSAPGLSGTMYVFTPSTSGIILWKGDLAYNAHTGLGTVQVMGFWNTSAVVDGFQVLFSSGNITSGTIKIYGIP